VKSSVVDAVEKYDKYGRRNFEFVRLGGENRYKTSALIAEWEVKEWYANNAWGEFTFDTCYVADGENYPDALAGGQLAGGYWNSTYKPAPLLLVKDGDSTAEALIKSEIDFDEDRFEVCIDENNYNRYLVGDDVYWKDDGEKYIFADAWYGNENTYFVNAALVMAGADRDNIFGTSVLSIDPLVVRAGENGGKIYRNLGLLGDDDFYGYILGGKNSVSTDKAKSLDKVVKDSLDDITKAINDEPTDDLDIYFWDDGSAYIWTAEEADKFSTRREFWAAATADADNAILDYFKLEYDTKINGVDRWIVKAPYGNKWKRVEGIYAYAQTKDARVAGVTVKQTDWIIVGETYNKADISAEFDWWQVIENNA
jgi:hypothetical protein